MTRSSEIAAVARRRRERERTARRDSILAAARETFVTKGFSGATMEEVALRAEITKPTLYGYFRTKDEILLHLMLPVFVQIGDQLAALRTRVADGVHADTEAFVADFVDSLLVPYRDDPDRFRLTQLLHQSRLLESLGGTTLEALDQQGRTDFQLARVILRDAVRIGLVRDLPISPLADLLWGIVVGVIGVEDIKNRTGGRAQFAATIKLAQQLMAAALTPEPTT